ncbi:unnamed protein product, partial [Closterium sp. NIES-53]
MPRRPAELRRPAKPCRPTEPHHPAEPRCTTEPHRPAEPRYPTACTASAATAATAAPTAMASPTVLTFDAEGRAVDFDVWWTTHDAVARLAVRSHLPSAERAHFGQYKTAKSLYDAIVARYSSPATTALIRLMLPYLFPDLAAFATVADLNTHLRTSDARYRSALPTEDHFLSLCPTELTVDLLEERLTAAEKSIVAVGASRGDPRAPFFEGCSPVPLLPYVAFAAAIDLVSTEEVGAASAPSGRHHNSRGKGGKGGGGDGGGGGRGGGGGGEVAVEVGVVAGVGASVAAVGVVEAAAAAVEAVAAVVEVAAAVVLVVEPRSVEALMVASASSSRVPIPDTVELPRWGDLLRQNVAIFDLDFDAILAAMYAVTDSAEGDCYLCVPLNPSIEAAALGASESATPGTGESAAPGAGGSALCGTAPIEALHTFTLDSGASRSFFRDSTALTPLSRPVAVSLVDPSGGPVLAHSSTVLPCPAAPSGLLSRIHLPLFSTNLVSGAVLQDAWVAASSQVFAAASKSSPTFAPCLCRPLLHETLLWHHRLGHPSLPRLRGMASRTLVSGLPRSLPPLPPGPALPAFLASRGGSAPLLTPPSSLRRRLPCILFTWTLRCASDQPSASCLLAGDHTYSEVDVE